MLLKFQFSNFRSFRELQELSLIATSLKGLSEAVVDPPGVKEKALKACALYGANASGKTTVLRAVQFMDSAIRESHRLWEPNAGVPIEPFKNCETSDPSEFVIDFLHGGVRHQYGFAVDKQRVLEEWLYTYPNGRKQIWFKRDRVSPISFGRSLAGDNRTIAALTRPNSLFLSAAAQNNHELLTPIYQWFFKSLNFVFGDRHMLGDRTVDLCANEENRRLIGELLAVADLGIVDVQHRVSNVDPDTRAKRRNAVEAVVKILDIKPPPAIQDRTTDASIALVHKLGEGLVPFDIHEESDGTLAYVGLLGHVIRALKEGTVLFIDELDSSLHPLIGAHIIGLFNSAAHNPNAAQLIFNTHDTNLLGHTSLRRDQVWFTEKDATGKSHLYPLTDFKPRSEENVQTGYLQGRYGAIPFVNSEHVLTELTKDAETR